MGRKEEGRRLGRGVSKRWERMRREGDGKEGKLRGCGKDEGGEGRGGMGGGL